jgi:signal peptidase II
MQAARGTSLDASDTTGPIVPTSMSRARVWRVFALVALTLYAVDLGTKTLALQQLSRGDDVPVVGELLQLHLTRNPGAAFSTGTEYTVVLSCIAMVAVVVVLWLSRRLGNVVWAVGLGVLLAGVAGNLTDRMFREPGPFRGHVIDFLMLPNWPVFNVADICINIAAGLILIQAFRGIRIDGTRSEHRRGDEAAGESGESGE